MCIIPLCRPITIKFHQNNILLCHEIINFLHSKFKLKEKKKMAGEGGDSNVANKAQYGVF